MGSFWFAKIEIGGTLDAGMVNPVKLDRFTKELGILLGFEEKYLRNNSLSYVLKPFIKESSGLLCGEDCETRYGEFPALEDACQDLGLPYDAWCEASGEGEAWITYYRPWKSPALSECATNSEGEPIIEKSTVLSLMENGKKMEALKIMYGKQAAPPKFVILE